MASLWCSRCKWWFGLSLRVVFNRVAKLICICFGFVRKKTLAPISQTIRSQTQPNYVLVARFFPRLTPLTCICLWPWLVHWVSCVSCDWLGFMTIEKASVIIINYNFLETLTNVKHASHTTSEDKETFGGTSNQGKQCDDFLLLHLFLPSR